VYDPAADDASKPYIQSCQSLSSKNASLDANVGARFAVTTNACVL
jgi:hypothetical protein